MGRGRAKAKQTKVARELKYSTGSLDPDALRRELAADSGGGLSTRATDDEHDDDEEDDDENR
jgi:hypothetical protein